MALGDNCTSGCTTKDHETWGECQRAKNQMIGGCRSAYGHTTDKVKSWDKDLEKYRAAHDAGIRPDATGRQSVERAERLSDKFGAAYGMDADFRVIPNEKGKMEPVFYKDIRAVENSLSGDQQAVLKAGREASKQKGLKPTFGGD